MSNVCVHKLTGRKVKILHEALHITENIMVEDYIVYQYAEDNSGVEKPVLCTSKKRFFSMYDEIVEFKTKDGLIIYAGEYFYGYDHRGFYREKACLSLKETIETQVYKCLVNLQSVMRQDLKQEYTRKMNEIDRAFFTKP